MGKIKQYFSEKGDKIKTSVKIDKDAPFFYISLIIIVILAILVRSSPVVNGVFLIKAFDPWYQFDSLVKLIDMGLYDWLHFHDYKFWYPEGVDRFDLRPGLLVTNALIYWFLNGIGIQVTAFQVAYYSPAFMGGLTVLVMYFLGKEILDRRAGLIAAFFLAFSPGHMQRTVCGFFDNETIGVLAVLLSFLFFIRAVKTGKISDGILAGLSIGYLALSWGGLTYVFSLLPLIVFIIILLDKYDPNILMAYTTSIMIGLLLYSINPSFSWGRSFSEMDFFVPFFFEIFLVGYHFVYMQKETGNYEKILMAIKWLSIPVVLAGLIIFWVKPEILPFNLGGRMASIINPNIRDTINLVASVGEHAPSPWSIFYYNSFIPILFIVPGIYFAIRRGRIEDILMIVFVLTLFYFTGSMIRIILLFAPAAALLGAYGLANIMKYFGTLMKKEQMITRRRKRQIQRTIGKSEGIVVYIAIGLLFFAQTIHATDIAAEQMGYADIVTAGALHDWEETLSWMKYNLDSSTVVVSWWDYGYWLSSIGNVTTVNDNGTWNQTRIGMTGMAMMQTDERISAEIFQRLGADYVVVFFGSLYNGFGGDEGKWPWMLRICNDNTKAYQSYGMEEENWYGENDQVDTVFDEAEYVNETNGLYYENWFESTLVKLMFGGAITSSAALPQEANEIQKNLVNQIEGVPGSQDPRADANGKLWSEYPSINGQYEPQYFNPAYFSMNQLVKVYEVDYSALDAAFEIEDTYLDTDGKGYACIKNTGIVPLKINGITLDDTSRISNLNYSVAEDEIAPDESIYVMFESGRNDWSTTDLYSISVSTNYISETGRGYDMTNDSTLAQVEIPEEEILFIDRSESTIEVDAEGHVHFNLNINNAGERPVLMENITVNGVSTPLSYATALIAPSESMDFSISRDVIINDQFNQDFIVEVNSENGKILRTTLGVNKEGYKISIKGGLGNLVQNDYLYDYSTYSMKEAPIGDYYLNYNKDSYLYDNGTLQLTVENTGDDLFSLQSIYANNIHYDIDLTDIVGGDPFLNPGDSVTLQITIDDVELETPVKIIITGLSDVAVVSDGAYFIPQSASESLSLIDDADSMTAAFTNETMRLVVKNTGSETLTLDKMIVNSTQATVVDLQSSMIIGGTATSLTLTPNEIAVLSVEYPNLKVNVSNTCEIQINTTTSFETSIELTAVLPTPISPVKIEARVGLKTSEASAVSGIANLIVSIQNDEQVLLDGFYFKIDDGEDYIYISLDDIAIQGEDDIAIGNGIITGASDDENLLYYYVNISNLALSEGTTLWIKIVTAEGYELVHSLTVDA